MTLHSQIIISSMYIYSQKNENATICEGKDLFTCLIFIYIYFEHTRSEDRNIIACITKKRGHAKIVPSFVFRQICPIFLLAQVVNTIVYVCKNNLGQLDINLQRQYF